MVGDSPCCSLALLIVDLHIHVACENYFPVYMRFNIRQKTAIVSHWMQVWHFINEEHFLLSSVAFCVVTLLAICDMFVTQFLTNATKQKLHQAKFLCEFAI